MRRARVYIASPYTVGDPVINTRTSLQCATRLLERGMAPFVPLLSMFWHFLSPQPYENWLAYDTEWVLACDALLRLEGKSSGADREVQLAVANSIPVFYSLDSLFAWHETWRG